ncbi:MAG: hypothetical protein ABIH42_08740 [Planctomycetota bacterium]
MLVIFFTDFGMYIPAFLIKSEERWFSNKLMINKIAPNLGERDFLSVLIRGSDDFAKRWGEEIGDSSSFYSPVTGGQRTEVSSVSVIETHTTLKYSFQLKMRDGIWQIKSSYRLLENAVNRESSFEALTDNFAVDFVSRFVFPLNDYQCGEIAGKKVDSTKSNKYFQFPVKEAVLFGRDRKTIIKITDVSAPQYLSPFLYLRHSKHEGWIAHARLLPNKWDNEILRICHPLFNKPVPDLISKPVLFLPFLARKLRYFRERTGSRLPFSSYPIVNVPKGTVVTIKTEVVFD